MSSPSPRAVARPPAVPKGHAYFGAFSVKAKGASEQQSFEKLTKQSCRPLDIVHVYLQWKHAFPNRWTKTAGSRGQDVLLSWAPTDMKTIESGAVDSVIVNTARQVRDYGNPVFLEFRWEMDRPNLNKLVHSPADYIAAYKRVHRIFDQQHVDNVSWVWCPSSPGLYKGYAQPYYPGDDVVDWMCTDAYPEYRFGDINTYQPLSLLVNELVKFRKLHHKPLMIGEYGVPTSYSPSDRARWLLESRDYIEAHPNIKAALYFDYSGDNVPAGYQHAIGTNPTVLKAWRAFATTPYFRPKDRADP